MHRHVRRAAAALALLVPLVAAGPAMAAPAGDTPSPAPAAPATHSLTLADGSKVAWSDDGTGTLTDPQGRTRAFPVPRSAGRTGLGATLAPSTAAITARADATRAASYTLGTKQGAAAQQAPVQPMNTGAVKLPNAAKAALRQNARTAPQPAATAAGLPANDGLSTSFQSYLNAQGVDAAGAFADAATYLHALPGAGQIVTNVSIGDLTDRSMADNGDDYVRVYGPTTVVENGQRYLDEPSMPLIPTYTADNNGKLDPLGSVEGQDPNLGEVLLDFSMMAPLPHDQQRPGATGSGATDLLGIAPGAQYRLVVPQEASYAGIAAALKAAADQQPRPSVITASLGFGTDEQIGFPGRYLEDDPTIRATLTSIVKSGIAVVVSSNDGTRLALPVSVGPDGGSTPTDTTTKPGAQTGIDDVEPTTTPSQVVDSGVIAAGATTTDDTLTSADTAQGVYPTTRYNGSAAYSSGFGTRVDLAAPGDDLPSLMHVCTSSPCKAQDVEVVLNGGTSASAPEIAAAVADVLQAAKATHQSLTPRQVRDLLVSTGSPITQPPQADQPLTMGTQLDVTAAVEKVLAKRYSIATRPVRLSVAQRQLLPTTSGTAFTESTDPAAIDLSGPADGNGTPSGQNAVSPITLGLDMTGDRGGLTYRVQAGAKGVFTSAQPSVRLTPAQILGAAGLPLASDTTRTVPVTFQALRGGKVVGQLSQDLTFLADDATYAQALAPAAPGATPLGRPVTVSYDLTGVRGLNNPSLVLSSVGHYTPSAAVDDFNVQWSTPLTADKGTVTIPASAFTAGGAGLYGVGIQQADYYGLPIYGDFRALRIGPAADERPAAPLLSTGGYTLAHAADTARSAPKATVSWDASAVSGADGAEFEVMSPGPTLYGSVNTVTNQNGSRRDDDGFNHPSTLTVKLPSVKGTTTLDLAALKLPTGLQYPVRVLATRHGSPIGQASPTSFLQYRDGDQVTGTVESFTVSGSKALISTDAFTYTGGTELYHLDRSATTGYDLATGTAGSSFAESTDGQLMQEVLGTDPASGHALIIHTPFAGSQAEIDVEDPATGTPVKVTQLSDLLTDSAYLEGGTVDAARHRGLVTTYEPDSGLSRVWSVDMTTGQVGTSLALNPHNLYRSYNSVSVDASTGEVFVATGGTMGPCLYGRVPYGAVGADFGTGTVTPVASMPLCVSALLPDGKGDKLYGAIGAAQPNPEGGNFPTSTWLTADQKTLTTAATADTGTRGPVWPALDDTHQVAVEASLYENGVETDNNAMSEITVLDPATGKVLARHPVANLVDSTIAGSNFDFTGRQGLFLDPATRTGWVINAWGTGLEQFSY
ncbi:S8 family serine peptidase [Actinacidiphila acididurans]|uniref:S8 family serine peptidase n=1 Tax=Actinacidiphila acididurans TaxID=2784346 RepID=A0ABS2U195_9ACTN|nr:S8 family serine peptidase [Actinacidiphila acididurans]MBM9509374.1 S8 family serine peptidase [Actinacidiphila acididurans]